MQPRLTGNQRKREARPNIPVAEFALYQPQQN